MTKITDLTAAAPDSADVIPYVDVSDTTENAAGTLKSATVAQIAAAVDVSALLPKAGGTMSGALEMNAAAINYTGVGSVLNITQETDTNHTFWEYAPKETPTLKWRQSVSAGIPFAGDLTRDDVTWNWGYNQGVQGGAANAADAAFYVQMENHYFPPGNGVAQFEYHLNWFSADSLSSYRPFQINVRKDGSSIDHAYVGDGFRWANRADETRISLSLTEISLYGTTRVYGGTFRVNDQLSVLGSGGGQVSFLNTSATKINVTPNPGANALELEFDQWGTIDFLATNLTHTGTLAQFNGSSFIINGAAPRVLITTESTDDLVSLGLFQRYTTGTAAAGIGGYFEFEVEANNGVAYDSGRITSTWFDATWNTRKGDLILSAFDTAEREALRLRATGSAALVIMTGIPTSDPAVAGALWSDGGTVKVSSG